MVEEITKKIKTKLNKKLVEDRRKDLTNFHQKGYNIKPYLEEMLGGLDDLHCGLGKNDFYLLDYGGVRLALYTLSDGETTFSYQKTQDNKYKSWP